MFADRIFQNYKILKNLYFDDICEVGSGLWGVRSSVFPDEGWNYVFSTDRVVDLKDVNLNIVKNFNPTVTPVFVFDIEQEVTRSGSAVSSQGDFSVWMSCGESSPRNEVPDLKFSILSKVTTEDQIKLLNKVFRRSYSNGLSGQIGYNDLPEYYPKGFNKMTYNTDRVSSICCYYDEALVGVCSIAFDPEREFCGLYNVGVVPEVRNKGIGKSLSQYATAYGIERVNRACILQTESHTPVQKLYEEIGYKVDFHMQYTNLFGD